MRSQSLQHDHAIGGAMACTQIIAPCLNESEQQEAFKMFYEAILATLKSYEEQSDRQNRRVNPSRN